MTNQSDIRAISSSVASEKKKEAVKEARARRKYRSNSVLMDSFFIERRNAETCLGLVVGLERVASLVSESGIVLRSYFVFVNGVSYRVESLGEAVNFLRGYCAGVATARGLVVNGGDKPSSATVDKVTG